MGNSVTILIVFAVLIFFLIVGSFFFVFNFILKKTNYKLKVQSENGEYSQITDKQKIKYIASMVIAGVLLGLLCFVFVK